MEPITKRESKKIDFTGDCLEMRKLTDKFCKKKRVPLYKLPKFAKDCIDEYLDLDEDSNDDFGSLS